MVHLLGSGVGESVVAKRPGWMQIDALPGAAPDPVEKLEKA
jgi:hypothetical protein